jgi:hypothetical protein
LSHVSSWEKMSRRVRANDSLCYRASPHRGNLFSYVDIYTEEYKCVSKAF